MSYRKYSKIGSYQERCLSSRSRKIQRLLSFNSVVKINLENATESLEQGEVWSPAITAYGWPTIADTKVFMTHSQFSKQISTDQWGFTLLLPSYFSDEIPCHSWLFFVVERATRGEDFSSTTKNGSIVRETLRYLSAVGCFSVFHRDLDILRRDSTSTVATLHGANIKWMNKLIAVVLEGGGDN